MIVFHANGAEFTLPAPHDLSESEYLDQLIADPTRTTKTPWRPARPQVSNWKRYYVNMSNGYTLVLT